MRGANMIRFKGLDQPTGLFHLYLLWQKCWIVHLEIWRILHSVVPLRCRIEKQKNLKNMPWDVERSWVLIWTPNEAERFVHLFCSMIATVAEIREIKEKELRFEKR